MGTGGVLPAARHRHAARLENPDPVSGRRERRAIRHHRLRRLERRPVALVTTAHSLQNHFNVGAIAFAAFQRTAASITPAQVVETSRRYGNHLGVEFGSVYASTAVIPAPHVWLGQGNDVCSTLDLFGPGFTLLSGPDATAWKPAAAIARSFGISLADYAIGAPGLQDRDHTFLDRYAIKPDGAVLVRPDGYVAWRSATALAEVQQTLTAVLAQLLHRPTPSSGE